ncbi:MAG TPA: hypothetical protein DCR46_06020 [Cytophagales bacterium]|nr:hypothetical protein [Cytophagales bacterium]
MEKEWDLLLEKLKDVLGKEATLDALLFLIGVQELGKGFLSFSKEEKQDLMHIGTCKVLSLSGYYELEGSDHEGWPHWKLVKNIPALTLDEQEKMLKMHVLEYFDKEKIT